MTRYEEVAAILRERIEHNIYRVGDRLPSIRAVCQELDVSISTAQEAYRQLMDVALIESRPKSGYFVLPSRGACGVAIGFTPSTAAAGYFPVGSGTGTGRHPARR
ncbi:hypothetical protein HSBAA_59220 [Vreelandella sulfidaeris]|uniref:HTH gntR-type domain-containing protein n=1 Tax=Vreelandella sulfidaeris TaxID=115553 RepID=A0A455UEA2_9GAMM|nr:hypothetical protein HSBAA_59220 [Halomonas sulfidaeris]